MNTSATLELPASQQIGRELSTFLADTYLVYVKSQNFHWNVTDPRFHSLHEFFEDQYKDLAKAADLIAERIRAVGDKSPGSMREFLELSRLLESDNKLSGDEMLKTLLSDHSSITLWLRNAIEQAVKWGDQGTADLYIERLRVHEKSAWMLKAHLKGG
jgi:starvation-inducible DNA-binding protein